jgi:hypothetical protein
MGQSSGNVVFNNINFLGLGFSLYYQSPAAFTLRNCSMAPQSTNCQPRRAIEAAYTSTTTGGGLALNLEGTSIKGFTRVDFGSAILALSENMPIKITLVDSELSYNAATTRGGAIYAEYNYQNPGNQKLHSFR